MNKLLAYAGMVLAIASWIACVIYDKPDKQFSITYMLLFWVIIELAEIRERL